MVRWPVLRHSCLVFYFDTQFSDSIYADFLIVLLVAIDSKEQVCYKTCKYLDHQAVLASCNKVINLEVAFPPAKEDFYVPAELVNHCHILCGKVITVCGNPVFFIVNTVADNTNFLLCLVNSFGPEQDNGIIEDNSFRFIGVDPYNALCCVFPDTAYKVFSLCLLKRSKFLWYW